MAMIATGLTMTAQRASDMDLASKGDAPSSYNILGISYDHGTLKGNEKDYFGDGYQSLGLNGVGFSYIHGFGVSGSLPMYVETGAKLSTLFRSQTDSDEDYGYAWSETSKMQWMSLSVPVNFAYRLTVADNFSITPYLGINFKVNILGQSKYEYEISGHGDYEYEESDWASVFSDQDMGGSDYTWNRFQMGWQIGARFQYSCVSLGVQYGTDFIKAFKYSEGKYNSNVTSGNFALTLGYHF